MPLLIILTTIISILITFLSSAPQDTGNSFLGYTSVITNFISQNWISVVSVFFVCCFMYLRTGKLSSDYTRNQKYLMSIFQTGASWLVGIASGFIILLFIAWMQLNIFSLIMTIYPPILGVNTDTKAIISTLKASDTAPLVVASDNDTYEELQGVATTVAGTDSVFGSVILPAIPGFLVLPILQNPASMMLIDNTLIVTTVNKNDIEKVSPIIGNLLIRQYFPTRKIKAYPTVEILTVPEYTKLRNAEYTKKLGLIDKELATLSSDISTLSAQIQDEKDTITSSQQQLTNESLYADKEYTQCVNDGVYQGNTYVHINTKEYCQNLQLNLQNQSDQLSTTVVATQTKLTSDESDLANYQFYQKYFSAQKVVMQANRVNIPNELGLFVEPNTLQIVLAPRSVHRTANFFETVAHEYLHYASYIPNKAFTSSFFEEGLTEYFARQTIKDNFHVTTNLGYPVYVKIITEMTKIIPESELADIYFTKDETRLATTLDRVYGDEFYEKNRILFETLPYSSNLNQTLQLANTIMKKIGGSPLTEKDLLSDDSGL